MSTSPPAPVRSYGIPIDHTDRWIGARFLPVDHYRALHLILTEGLVESALAVTSSAARLRAATRRLAEEQDPGLRPLIDAILKIVESGLVDHKPNTSGSSDIRCAGRSVTWGWDKAGAW